MPRSSDDEQAVEVELREDIQETARRARARIGRAPLPAVIGHADWETQNLRWHGGRPYAVHDWDSLAWLPEAALVGSAAGGFATAGAPSLAPVGSSEAFLHAYEHARDARSAPRNGKSPGRAAC